MKEERKGELYVLFESVLWSLFPVVTVLSYSSLGGLASLAWSTFVSIFFFAGVVWYKGSWRQFFNRTLWKYIALAVFWIGILFYGLYFFGLEYTTPGNAAIIAL
ncbi:MAG: hypothetical protein RIQ56_244, partial [Candidatus Parcubacteria bacterium]